MALYDLIEISTGRVINIVEWDGVSEVQTGSLYQLSPTVDETAWKGPFSAEYNYIDIYGGEFYGTFHGLHVGNTDGIASYAISSSYALTASYIESGVSLDNVDHISFDTTPVSQGGLATLVWNDGDGTLDLGLKGGNVTLQLGQQEYAMVFNDEATTLLKGELVYVYGAQGNRISVKRADNSSELTSKNTFGMVAESIASGAEGLVITNGTIHGLNITTGLPPLDFQGGDTLYLGTNGDYTKVKPTAPTQTVVIGFVERVHANQGSIFIKIDNGYELEELHNVLTPTPTTGDLLSYNGDTNLWTNTKVLSGSYKLSGSLDVSGSITASLSGSLSGSVIGFFSGSATGSFTGSFYGVFDGIKSGTAPNSPVVLPGGIYAYNVSFLNNYTTTNYAVSVIGTTDARIWTIENKATTGFRINTNSTVATTGEILWISIPYNS